MAQESPVPELTRIADETMAQARARGVSPNVVIDDVMRQMGESSTITRHAVLSHLGKRKKKKVNPKKQGVRRRGKYPVDRHGQYKLL